MVDFIEASPLRYALTFKPTIYVSHIRQFWSTTRIETTEEGTQILATVDGVLRNVTESSLRRNLKFQDEEGINSFPNTELFENLTLMGYNISPNQKFTFQKGQFSHQWKFLIHTIMQCLSPKSTGFNEFSSNIATALVCLATNRTYNFLKMIFDGLVKNVNNKVLKFLMYLRQYTRRARIAQSSTLSPVADEPASPVRDVSQGEAFPTDSGFIADQDRVTIAKSSTLLHESAPRVTSPTAEEGTQEVEINRLKERVKILEDKGGVIGDRSGDDARIKGRRIDEEEVSTKRVSGDTEEVRLDVGEVAAERASEDTEEMATVLTTMDAATVLASGTAKVPTGSGSIPTAGPSTDEVPTGSDVVPTASLVFATTTVVTPYRRRKGKEVMVEFEALKKLKLQEQIDAQIARIHAEEELQIMIDGLDRSNEVISKHLAEYDQAAADLTIRERIELINELVKYQDHHSKILQYQAQQKNPRTKKQKRDFYMAVIRNNLGWKAKDFKGMSFEEVEAKFKTVWEQIEGGVSNISKGEAAWLKRKGIRSKQKIAKKQKILEEVPKEVKSFVEVFEEKIKEMMQFFL
nr:synaptobrevin, longin-like domain protein [Tanacetum cinerariifolium]